MDDASVKKLLADMDQVLGAERVRLSTVPHLLRRHDPSWIPYRSMTAKSLCEILRANGIRVPNTNNILRFDPSELPSRYEATA